MTKIDLITGFLGSGKTTFLRIYAKYLLAQGERIAILENDFGAINVDRMLLADLESDQCDVEMVLGDRDYETHQRRFKSKLITLGMLGYDRILVEPSGIYDVDEFFDTLQEEPLNRWYVASNVITIVDAHLPEDTSEETEYLLTSQLANAGRIILSKSQQVDPKHYPAILSHINGALARFSCSRVIREEELITKPWEQLTQADLADIAQGGYRLEEHVKMPISNEDRYDQLFFMNVEESAEDLREEIAGIFADPACGRVLRIKGYLSLEKREMTSAQKANQKSPHAWLKINATAAGIELEESQEGQAVLIVIGEQLHREEISRHFHYEFGSDRTQ